MNISLTLYYDTWFYWQCITSIHRVKKWSVNKQTNIQTKKILQQIKKRYSNMIIGNSWGILNEEVYYIITSNIKNYEPKIVTLSLPLLKPFSIIFQHFQWTIILETLHALPVFSFWFMNINIFSITSMFSKRLRIQKNK